jgi:hypothetical protein
MAKLSVADGDAIGSGDEARRKLLLGRDGLVADAGSGCHARVSFLAQLAVAGYTTFTVNCLDLQLS